jgi:signal peptidase I
MRLAPSVRVHGVLIDIYGLGVLILGESGIGKSESALELITRGHRLVADDSVEIRDKVLYINGEPQDEPYVVFKGDQSGRKRGLPGVSFGPRVVPEGTIFCLGDNRDNSLDSRFWGPVPLSYVKGRAVLIYWSYEAKRDDWEWRGVLYRMKQLAEVFVNFLTKTRWERSFRLIH